ncbi:COG1470 family protein [Thermococcus sp.]
MKMSEIHILFQKSFTLRWLAQAGEHSYVLKLYNLIGGQKFEEDKNNTLEINVVGASQQFAVSLEAFPRELDGGGTVWFTVHVKNFVNAAISLSGFVENGVVIKRIGGFEGRIPANSEKNITFSYKVYSVGEHTFKLFLDNYDGKPNGEGEEHWSKTTVEVKPSGNVIASMSCDPAVVPLDGSTTCTVHLGLKSADTVTLNLEEVDFGGKKVWPDGPSSIVVPEKTVTLTPTNMQEDLTVTITVNDELANYYFGERPWDPIDRWIFRESFKNRPAGYPYLVRAKFSSGTTVSGVSMIVEN